ncbi:16S rRNA (cytidine(1402)-2'-O)-methyltransferase [Persephonella atlantica]|uniref:Ribosomal RNA small subunit methyltransferase I n=1 Tax=Persephonella atlantica TaxID=2699429 RepID=A0ABS1GG75_9AQUI|nr:16S rRNA (cytidine(1402)-2'-O)-methyltransferase [Persephonella atlantica]MBK3331903.1 16S rRNA (cytidine(1402)-2'-O)-methyltransferase [Persephonella atlantica]
MTGTLFVVATPIGNLKDITLRALETLESVDVIACEDTRVTKKLLNRHGITDKRLIPYHEHNEREATEKLIKILKAGKSIALVSDAGTPCISDPGFRVVKRAWEEGITVSPIPGAFAGAAALSASGLPTDRFLFVGFLPKKRKEEELREAVETGATVIIYESPKRVLDTLTVIDRLYPDAFVVVAKELTKIHERFFRGKPAQIIDMLSKEKVLKGEFVILVRYEGKEEIEIETVIEEGKKLLEKGYKSKEIATILHERYGISKKEAYKIVQELKG